MRVDDFNYFLPEQLIAQRPCDKRDASRLLVVHRVDGTVEHKHFYDIIDYLKPGDCLVLNNSKVLPARLFGEKRGTGAKVEFLLIKRIQGDIWQTMVRPGRRIKPGDVVVFGPGLSATVKDFGEQGTRIVEFAYQGIFMERLEEYGTMPLPPYIERPATNADNDRYQTVYCEPEGSVAAPTAGLHFTNELLHQIRERGVATAYVTLHVGIGTFRPVKAEEVEDHEMHYEEYEIPADAARLINETKSKGGRIISVGTTSARTLESAAVLDEQGKPSIQAGTGSTGIFIYPGYRFKMVDGLITNFHLPKSTLLMLVSALYSRERMLEIYQHAIEHEYRFFSYGDAMFIE
jgi:S-adenosylmethionine:tRNA ribosyltransferase-isomerase